jgi:hypothetical protein
VCVEEIQGLLAEISDLKKPPKIPFSDIDKAEREERKRKIQELWLACYTAEEIAESVQLDSSKVAERILPHKRETPAS